MILNISVVFDYILIFLNQSVYNYEVIKFV